MAHVMVSLLNRSQIQFRFWISDEYGPYVYRLTPTGQLIQTLSPPAAILPMVNGKLNFTSETDPETGRAGNQGEYYSSFSFRLFVKK